MRALQTQKHKLFRHTRDPNPMEDTPDQAGFGQKSANTSLNLILLTRAFLGLDKDYLYQTPLWKIMEFHYILSRSKWG